MKIWLWCQLAKPKTSLFAYEEISSVRSPQFICNCLFFMSETGVQRLFMCTREGGYALQAYIIQSVKTIHMQRLWFICIFYAFTKSVS